jgi:hypothetical protein
MTPNPFSCLAAIAESQIGTQEDSAHTNRGAAILKYQQATDLPGQGWAWCAAFVDWCVEQFILQFPQKVGVRIYERPKTAGAFDWENWARAHGCWIFENSKDAQRGDIVIFTFSHIGIVSGNDAGGLYCIEGNSNTDGSRDGYEVVRHDRTETLQRGLVKCFIRLPARAEPV